MAYSFRTDTGDWTLYTRRVALNGGHERDIYFFSRGAPKSGVPTELPTGYTVKVAESTGLPFLKKA